MFRWLMVLTLTTSVAFYGFQLHENETYQTKMRENSLTYLKMVGKDTWIEHFDCFYCCLVYILMLAPLTAVTRRFGMASFLASGAIKMVALLYHFDISDLPGSFQNTEWLKLMVIAAGLFMASCSGKRRGKGRKGGSKN